MIWIQKLVKYASICRYIIYQEMHYLLRGAGINDTLDMALLISKSQFLNMIFNEKLLNIPEGVTQLPVIQGVLSSTSSTT